MCCLDEPNLIFIMEKSNFRQNNSEFYVRQLHLRHVQMYSASEVHKIY